MRSRVLELALCAAIIMATFFFLEYFILLGNALYILWSFVLFLAFAVALSFREEYVRYATLGGLFCVVAGALIYLGVDVAPGINTSIIGYYLLISAMLAIYIRAFMQKPGHTRRLAALASSGFAKRRYPIYAIVTIGLLALLVLPVWPTPSVRASSSLPYVPIEVYSNSNAPLPESITININASRYVGMENRNLDNVRFLFDNGTEIPAMVSATTPVPANNASATLHIGNGKESGMQIRMYFIPFRNGGPFVGGLTATGGTAQTSNVSSGYSYLFGAVALNPASQYVQETRQIYVTEQHRYVQSGSDVFAPYYGGGVICAQGTASNNESLRVVANRSISLFLQTPGEFANSTLVYNRSAVGYRYYIEKFSEYSKVRLLNFTASTIDLSLSVECEYYTIVTDNETSVYVNYTDSYSAPAFRALNVSVPSVLVSGYVSTFLPESFGALIGTLKQTIT